MKECGASIHEEYWFRIFSLSSFGIRVMLPPEIIWKLFSVPLVSKKNPYFFLKYLMEFTSETIWS